MRKFPKYRIIPIVLTILLAFSWSASEAQIRRKGLKKNNRRMAAFKGQKRTFPKSKRYNYIGFSVNALNYFGDLAPKENASSTDISFTRPGFSIFAGHRFGPRYTLRAAFTWGNVRGSDFKSADLSDDNAKFRYVRNLHFRNFVKELSVTAMFDLLENNASYLSRVQFTPYAFVGIAAFHHNPKAIAPDTFNGQPLEEAGEWIALQPLGTEGQNSDLRDTDNNFGVEPYKRIQAAIPFGVGARYRLNQILDFSFEIGVRYLFFDYIDDVSNNYVDLGLLGSDLARAMSDRSMEATGGAKAEQRDLTNPALAQFYNNAPFSPFTYDGTDGQSYTVVRGFGSEDPQNKRGDPADRDIYVITSFRIAYIFGGAFRRAKFR